MATSIFAMSYRKLKAIYAANKRKRNLSKSLEEFDSGIQVSESSEYTDGEELCDAVDISLPKSRSPDGLSDSMTAVADDLCPSNQLKINSSGETTSDQLQLADYSKHEAKQATTVLVNNNNNNREENSQSTTNCQAENVSHYENERASNNHGIIRITPIDLSAITEEADEGTNTSLHVTCSHEGTSSDYTSTPLDKSSQRRNSISFLKCASPCLKSGQGNHTYVGCSYTRSSVGSRRSYSNPEIYSEDTQNQPQEINDSSDNVMSGNTGESSPTSSQQTDQKLIGDEPLSISLNSSQCQLACESAKASFVIGDMSSTPPSTPSSPTSPPSTSSMRLFTLHHVESDAKLCLKSHKKLPSRIRRSKSYSTNVSHTSLLQQQMNQLTFDQNGTGEKVDGRLRKFSNVAKNVRNVLSFFKRRNSDVHSPIPSADVIESWAHNFNNLLNDPYGLTLFKNFLCSEYSEENIEFWIACEDYKKLKPRQHAQKAQKIYSDYVTVHAPKEVNLDSKTRLETMKNLSAPDKMAFDLAQSRIQCLMEKDSYPRFLRSQFYTTLVSQAKLSTE